VPVVVVDPGFKSLGALNRSLVGEAVGPFAQGALDEAFGLPVGLGPVGAGELVAHTEIKAGTRKVSGSEGWAVVSQQAFDLDAEARIVGDRVLQELDGAETALIRIHVGEADARMVVDRHKQAFPAGALDGLAAVAGDAVAGRSIRPSVLMSMCSKSPGASCS